MKARFALVGLLLPTLAVLAQGIQTSPAPSTTVAESVAKDAQINPWTNVGAIVDPDRDCAFTFSANSLFINVPGGDRPHDFAPELNVYNSPRVLSKVQGDFAIQVKIDGKFGPGEESTLPGRTGYNGAGLVLIASPESCITLARATLQRSGIEPRGYINFEMRSEGELVRMGAVTDRPVTSDTPIYLRLERKGNQVLGSISEDGKQWEELPAKTLPENWPDKAEAGLIAVSTSTAPFTPHFSEFKREPAEQQGTISTQEAGTAQAPQESPKLNLDEIRQKLPEKVTPISNEHLASKVPHFYYFEYEGEPQPGKRYWVRVNGDTWVERYPDGFQSTFKVLGHTKVEGTEGTIVVKVSGDLEKSETTNDGGLQVFIPDKGSEQMHHWYRNSSRGDTEWNDIGPMEAVQ
ncbi:hypothetical protein ACXR0O_26385 [Verrucomicrobiota bacterium sgz303538]